MTLNPWIVGKQEVIPDPQSRRGSQGQLSVWPYSVTLSVFNRVNSAHSVLCHYPQAQNSARTISSPLSVRAEWARFIRPVTRALIELLRSKSCQRILQIVPNCVSDSSAKQRPSPA